MSTHEIYNTALKRFQEREDIEQIDVVIGWLKAKGYDIDANHIFGGREFGGFGKVKNLSINGVNVQGYSHNCENSIEDFNFYTTNGACYHVDMDWWAMNTLTDSETAASIRDIVVRLN